MKEKVQIKSYPKGLVLHLNPEIPFEEILEEIAFKFADARGFFGKASVALAIEGIKVTPKQEESILETIRETSDIKVCCIVGKDEETANMIVKAMDQTEEKGKIEPGITGQFLRGGLQDNEVLEVDKSIIILGDIAEGCAVISSGNIIILGGLYGEAYAGGNGNKEAFVAALEMEPERIKIGDFKYKPGGKKSIFGNRNKACAKIARVENDEIIMEPLTKDQLFRF